MKSKKIYLFVDLIIVLLIGCFICFYYKIAKSGVSRAVNETIIYTVKIENVSKEFIEKVKVGDILYDDLDNYSAGVIESFKYDNMFNYYFNEEEHTYKKNVVLDKYVLYIDVKCDVYNDTFHLFVNDFDIKIGKEVDLYNKEYALYGFIVDIEV